MYSNNIYTHAFIRGLREKYPEGTRVRLVSMFDPYNTTLKPGDEGTVTFIDAQGTIFVDWECGSSLGLIYGEDLFEVIE